nr:hypothetical protein [Tanacetum cinerariifolium]GEZ51997.1 hypothetical protein [Tanacetum cinerariifolium]
MLTRLDLLRTGLTDRDLDLLLLSEHSGRQRRNFRNKSRGTNNSSQRCYNVSLHFVAQVVSLPPDETPSYYQPLLKATAGPLDIRASPSALRRLAALYLREERLAAPYLLRRLAGPYLLRRLTAPYLLRRLAVVGRLAAPYLLRRHYTLVICLNISS